VVSLTYRRKQPLTGIEPSAVDLVGIVHRGNPSIYRVLTRRKNKLHSREFLVLKSPDIFMRQTPEFFTNAVYVGSHSRKYTTFTGGRVIETCRS
jgi:hypothetical protein